MLFGSKTRAAENSMHNLWIPDFLNDHFTPQSSILYSQDQFCSCLKTAIFSWLLHMSGIGWLWQVVDSVWGSCNIMIVMQSSGCCCNYCRWMLLDLGLLSEAKSRAVESWIQHVLLMLHLLIHQAAGKAGQLISTIPIIHGRSTEISKLRSQLFLNYRAVFVMLLGLGSALGYIFKAAKSWLPQYACWGCLFRLDRLNQLFKFMLAVTIGWMRKLQVVYCSGSHWVVYKFASRIFIQGLCNQSLVPRFLSPIVAVWIHQVLFSLSYLPGSKSVAWIAGFSGSSKGYWTPGLASSCWYLCVVAVCLYKKCRSLAGYVNRNQWGGLGYFTHSCSGWMGRAVLRLKVQFGGLGCHMGPGNRMNWAILVPLIDGLHRFYLGPGSISGLRNQFGITMLRRSRLISKGYGCKTWNWDQKRTPWMNSSCGYPRNGSPCFYWHICKSNYKSWLGFIVRIISSNTRFLCIPKCGKMISYFWSPKHVSGIVRGYAPLKL
ncbi:hypothetical protein HanIR_Chr10g0450851 [Helianthus annuus]|nr:hypothetical protein HanIR_Chr10g0450851 [Helianthus annuus]